MLRFSVLFLQLVLAITFIVIPVSRLFGASTLQQVLSLGVPPWLIWVANVVELSGAVLLLLGLRIDLLAVIGALLLASSMAGQRWPIFGSATCLRKCLGHSSFLDSASSLCCSNGRQYKQICPGGIPRVTPL